MLYTPNLLLVGFQKCGSSSLFDLLMQHPNITGTKPKETFFFTDEEYENYNPKSNWNTTPNAFNLEYQNTEEEIDKVKYFLEGSVCNFYQKTALKYAKETKGIKVIFIVRDPIERFVSNFRYFGTDGIHLKPGIQIEEYYSLNRNKIKSELLRYGVEHGKYLGFVNEWNQAVGDSNIIVTSLKKLTESSQSELNRIWSFLGLETICVNEMAHMNKTTTIRFPWLHSKLVNIFGGLGFNQTWFYSLYLKMISGDKKVVLPYWVKKELEVIYKEEYKHFKEIL